MRFLKNIIILKLFRTNLDLLGSVANQASGLWDITRNELHNIYEHSIAPKMTEPKRHRIKFYSKEDRSAGNQLTEAEELLNSHLLENELTLIDLIEFYNIKLYFDNKIFLRNWTEEVVDKYINRAENLFEILKAKILQINDETLEAELDNLDYNYFENYWSLLSDLNVYKGINEETIINVLKNHPSQIDYILAQKRLVEKYDRVVRAFLISFEGTPVLILSSLEKKDSFGNKSTRYFPKSLSIKDKEAIIIRYLDSERPNLNYVRLIENSRDSNEFRLTPKTRLKAKKKSEQLNEEILQGANVWSFGISVSFSKDQIEPRKFNSDNTGLQISYSENFIDQFRNNVDLFKIFKYLFDYTDEKNLITLVNKQCELDVLERTFMQSKNEYEAGAAFRQKENTANLQLSIYDHYLQRKGNSIESLVSSYVDYINEKIKPHKLLFKIPSAEKSHLERIRIVAPDFEFLLKQYKTFIDEKYIDIELIQIDSTPIRLSDISSLKARKYLCSDNPTIGRLKYYFYSDQSPLYYINHFDEKHNNFYTLLMNEDVKLEYFANYQIEIVESLIKEGYLKIDNRGYVVLDNEVLIYLIGDIYYDEVIVYWNYSKEIRDEMDELIDKGLFVAESTLFTRQERNYLNYYLNKKEFTNGFDLRNKYLHGTNSFSENEHKADFIRLLKIIILTLLKIEDDVTLPVVGV
ncbi:MAG: hypothetical protein JWO03_2098 [Bacteroidetes bacterium]|nr:hypothetical protein [Bacteroidota bacterium]